MATTSCGSTPGAPTDGGANADASDAASATSLTITPPQTDVTLALDGTTTVTLRATAGYADGASRDETTRAVWSVRSTDGGTTGAVVTEGRVTLNRPGAFTVRATLGRAEATATIRVKVVGELVLPGTPAGAAAALGGAAASAPQPTVAYPLEGAIFPGNLGNVEVQVTKTDAAQSLVRVGFDGDYAAVTLVGACTAIPGAATGCAVTIDRRLVPYLVAASAGERMELRVRLARPDGGAPVESAPREVRWAGVDLTGALYYWSTRSGASNTAIYRYDFGRPNEPPTPFFAQAEHSPTVEGQRPCVGCHSVSRDGRRMALSFGGSDPGNFAVYDVATRAAISTQLGPRAETGPQYFAGMSALSPDGARVITVKNGAMTLRRVDATLGAIGPALFATGLTAGDLATEPYWSGDGRRLVFVGWNPTMYTCNNGDCGGRAKDNGDLTPYGQIYVADVTGDAVGAPRLLVPRSSANGGREYTSHYPSVTDDGRWVVFNRTSCSAPGNNSGYPTDRTGAANNCSGYDNPGARLMVVPAAGGAPVDLARLNDAQTWTNSWPRWAPNRGTFRGRDLYWVAFSSKRPYGLRLPGDATGAAGTKPQLWFAAVTLEPNGTLAADPSHAPIWLPLQNGGDVPAGNHVPQWVAVFVPTPG